MLDKLMLVDVRRRKKKNYGMCSMWYASIVELLNWQVIRFFLGGEGWCPRLSVWIYEVIEVASQKVGI